MQFVMHKVADEMFYFNITVSPCPEEPVDMNALFVSLNRIASRHIERSFDTHGALISFMLCVHKQNLTRVIQIVAQMMQIDLIG